jgi:BioD-like phosphotransacetylase family protein
LRHLFFDNRPDRLARHAVKYKAESLFGQQRDNLARRAIDDYVQQNGRRRRIVVPQAVVGDLEMPDPLTRFGF